MQVDNLTRALLGGILACLLILLGRGFAAEDRAASPSPERFTVSPVNLQRGPQMLLRVDGATGEAWRMGLMDAGRWEPLPEGPDGVPSPGATAPGRYSIRPISQKRGAPTLVRSDHLTGRVWRKGAKDDGPWVLVPNPGEETSADEPAAQAEAATP